MGGSREMRDLEDWGIEGLEEDMVVVWEVVGRRWSERLEGRWCERWYISPSHYTADETSLLCPGELGNCLWLSGSSPGTTHEWF